MSQLIKAYDTSYTIRFSVFYDSDRSQVDNWSSWYVRVSLALQLVRILLKCVSYALIKLKIPGTSIFLKAEPSNLISQEVKAPVCL